jgi:heme exporter protein CcmD
MSEWLAMGGYGFFVWSSYGALALAIAVELWLLRRRRIRARELVRQTIEEESA